MRTKIAPLEWYNVYYPKSDPRTATVVGHVQSDWIVDADKDAKARFGGDVFAVHSGSVGGIKYPIGTPYYRRNPLSTTELVIGGLVGVAVLGIGGYILYQALNPTPAAAAASGPTAAQLQANPALASYEAATTSPGAPAGTNPGGYPVVSS